MKQKRVWIPAVIAAGFLIFYFYPTPQKPFGEIFTAVDAGAARSLADFRRQYPPQQVMVDGRAWEYARLGDGGPAILFLHGMTGAYDIWWQQLTDLAADYTVIAVTYPPVDSLAAMSDGVLAVLAAEGIDQFSVVGSSLGGYLAQYLAATVPERIEKAVFANTFPPNDIIAEKNKALGGLLPIIPEWGVMAFLRSSTEKGIYPASGHSELVRAYMLEQSYGRMSKAQFMGRYHAVIDPFTAPNLTMPVMIIEADNDPLVEPALRQMLKAAYPAARVETLSGVGHFSYLNEPDVYTGLLRDFLAADGR